MIVLALLLAQAAPAATPAPATTGVAKGNADKRQCRTFGETGSFIRKVKTCRTKAEWARIEEETRDQGRTMQSLLATDRGG